MDSNISMGCKQQTLSHCTCAFFKDFHLQYFRAILGAGFWLIDGIEGEILSWFSICQIPTRE